MSPTSLSDNEKPDRAAEFKKWQRLNDYRRMYAGKVRFEGSKVIPIDQGHFEKYMKSFG